MSEEKTWDGPLDEKMFELLTAGEAKALIDDRLLDFSRPYWDKNHPLHKQDIKEMKLLHEIAFPSPGEDSEFKLTDKQRKGLVNLKKKWGDDYEANTKVASETYLGVIATYKVKEFEKLINSGLGNERGIIELFYEIGRQGREGAAQITCPHCGKAFTNEED